MLFGCGMCLTALLMPILMLVFGYRYARKVPETMKSGYRTRRAMRSRETWVFAHRRLGAIWKRLGWVTLLPSAVGMLLVLGRDDNTIGTVICVLCTVQALLMTTSFLPVERTLKEHFDENGIPNDAETLAECQEDEP